MSETEAYARIQRQEAWDEYEAWFNRKQRDLTVGYWAMGISFAMWIALKVLPNKPMNWQGMIVIVSYPLMLWGGVKVAQAKGHSGWQALIPIWVVGLGDKNRRDAPQKPGTGVKPVGSDLSDW